MVDTHVRLPWRARGLAVLGLVVLLLAALAAALSASGSTKHASPARLVASRQAPAAGLGANWYGSAPYFLTGDGPDGSFLTQMMARTGQKAFVMSFILDGGGCTPSWDATDPVSSDTSVGAIISAVRGAGGDVSASAGGFNGSKLGQGCGSVGATASAYQQVVSKYGLKAIDFDLEEPEIENATAIANELGAAKMLQQNNAGLFVTITMPSGTSGANFFGQALLNQAASIGFTPASYSIMPFDNGFSGGASQVSALQAFHSQLMNTFHWDSTTAFQHEGVSGMNGRSDTGEMFLAGDFQTVLSFVMSNGMTRFTFWSENRDRQCTPPDNNGRTSAECSSVPQQDGAFTAFTVKFAGGTPGTPPPTPTPPPPGSCQPAWSATQIFVGGSQASFNSHNWTAKWWTQGDQPGGPVGVWTDNGPCSGGGGGPSPNPSASPPAPGSCAAAWSATQIFVGGNMASFHSHNWTARWWTQGDQPGGPVGVWTDDGACT